MSAIIFISRQLSLTKKIFLGIIMMLQLHSAFADNENYDGQDVSGQSFTEGSYVGSSWKNATAINTKFTRSDCSNASFIEANLTNANFQSSNLTNADFTNAIITGTFFASVKNFTKEQLYSTQSYKDRNLSRTALISIDLSGCDFSYYNLQNTILQSSNLSDVNFTNAIISGTSFTGVKNFTKEQLYSTQNYKDKDLSNVVLMANNLGGWDFSGQNLTGAMFASSNLSDVNFTDAIVERTDFTNVKNFTKEQLYSTQSYKDKNLSGISFYGNNLIEWNFNYQNLKEADFFNVNLQNAGFSGASLVNTRFTRADLRGANINNITGNYITEHTIMTNGNINNFNMDSLGDSFSIRKYAPASEGGEMISAKISEAAAISGGAALTLENGAELEVLNAADLTVENGSSIIINTDADSSTSFKVNSGGGLAFENGAILEINVVSDLSAQDILQIEIMEFAENASIAGLDALVKGETILLNVNGSEWLGEWDYALENNQMLITVSVPEPAVCAAAIGALALGLALRYRNYKN